MYDDLTRALAQTHIDDLRLDAHRRDFVHEAAPESVTVAAIRHIWTATRLASTGWLAARASVRAPVQPDCCPA